MLKINARNDTRPFTEEIFRRRIEECSVAVARNGRPLWRPLLRVLHENKRLMKELGVLYDVQNTIAAVLKVIRDIPHGDRPMFGHEFSSVVEKMDARLLRVRYDDASKTSSDPGKPWHQGLLTQLVEAIIAEEDRLCARFVDPVDDDIPSIDQVDSEATEIPRKQICIFHALGANGCRFSKATCRFEHVDHDALTQAHKEFIRTFILSLIHI